MTQSHSTGSGRAGQADTDGRGPAHVLQTMLGQLGIPPADEFLSEVRQLRAVAEQALPHLGALAEHSASLPDLVKALNGVKPQDLERLTKALEETGENLKPLLPLAKRLAGP